VTDRGRVEEEDTERKIQGGKNIERRDIRIKEIQR
jgi:hypothetical protein